MRRTDPQTSVAASVTVGRRGVRRLHRDPIVSKRPGSSLWRPSLRVLTHRRRFSDLDSTIAARNARVRKAQQPALSIEPETFVSATSFSRPSDTLNRTIEDDAPPSKLIERQLRESLATADESSSPVVPRHEVRQAPALTKASTVPSEVIVLSSDSDEVEAFSTTSMYGSTDVRPQPTTSGKREHERQVTESEQALQQLFEENRAFYESLDREKAQQEAQMSMSEASTSSIRMESMVPDASTSYETSSWAPTRSVYSHEAYPAAPSLECAPALPVYSHQGYYRPPRAGTPIQPAFVHNADGRMHRYSPVHVAPPPVQPGTAYTMYRSSNAAAESSHAWHPNNPLSYRPALEPASYMANSCYYPQPSHQPLYQPLYQPDYPAVEHQQNWQSSASTSSAADHERARLASFKRPKPPREAQQDKAKADRKFTAPSQPRVKAYIRLIMFSLASSL